MATHRSSARSLVRRGGVALVGLVGIAAVAGVVRYPQALALPAAPAPATAVHDVAVEAPEETWVCPGPATLTDPDTGGTGQFAAAPSSTTSGLVAFASGGAATLGELGTGKSRPLATGTGPGALVVTDDTAPQVLTVDPTKDADAAAVASVGSLTDSGDLRGLAGATCARPGIDHWLVGGSTELGASTQLIIQNPGRTPATVNIEVWGPSGLVALGSGSQQLVAPGKQSVVLLEAAAPEQARTVVHVSATGGLVTAYLQHNTLAGLVPMGVDYVTAGDQPQRRAVLSGLVSLGEPIDDAHAPRVRLLAPGRAIATVKLQIFGPAGASTPPGAEQITLEPGKVTDVSLGGTDPGWYAVLVTADQPVVAGAYMDRVGAADASRSQTGHQYDRAWLATQPGPPTGADGTSSGAGAGAVSGSGQPGAAAADSVSLGRIALIEGTTSQVSISVIGPDSAAPDRGQLFTGALTAFGGDGKLLGKLNVEVPAGATRTVAASDIAAGAAVIALDGDAHRASVVWNVLASGGPPAVAAGTQGSLLTVLEPELWRAQPRAVHVRADTRLGAAG